MTSMTLPFIAKSQSPVWALVCLALVGAAFVATCWLLGKHHHAHRKAKKAGLDRRHDGRHGNH